MSKFSWRDLAGPNPNPMTAKECIALQELCEELPSDPVIIQIGAERGTSTLAMAEARRDATIYSIDQGECPQEINNMRKAGLDLNILVPVRGKKSWDVGKTWDKMCDMLLVDGDHSAAGVAKDIDAFTPWLKQGGLLVFHDYIAPPIPPEIKGRVHQAVDEKITEVEYEEILWIERLKAFKKL